MDQNPYAAAAAVYNNPLVRFFGGQSAANDHSAALGAAQAWRAQQDLADSFQPQLPAAPAGDGPMGQIAAYAQSPQAAQGPSVPPLDQLLPKIAKARALGVDTTGFVRDYNAANPAYAVDNTPDYWQDNNGARHRSVGTQDQVVVKAPPKVMTLQNYDGSQTIVAVDPSGQPVGIPQQAVGQGENSSVAPPIMGAPKGSRAARNNNPGNLRWDGRSNWQGMTGVDPQGFVQFDTPDNGIRAAGINLGNQQKLHGLNTLSAVIQKYAPQADNNDTAAYIASVAKQTGLDPNAPLDLQDPNVRNRIMQAMFNVEGGGTPVRVPQAPQMAVGGPPMLSVGQDAQSQNPAVRELYKSQGYISGTDANGGVAGMSNDAIEQIAQSVAQGAPMPSLGMGKQAAVWRMAIQNRVADILGGTGNTTATTMADYKANSGSLTDMVKQRNNSANYERTVNDNLDIVDRLIKKGAGPTGRPILDRVIQYGRGEYAGDPDVTAYTTALQTVMNEYTAVMAKNGQPTESMRAHAETLLNPGLGAEQVRANIGVLRQEMDNRIKEYDSGIEQTRAQIAGRPAQGGGRGAGVPQKQPAMDRLTPEQQSVHKSLPHTGTAGAKTNPYFVVTQAGYDSVPSGSWFVDTDGTVAQKK